MLSETILATFQAINRQLTTGDHLIVLRDRFLALRGHEMVMGVVDEEARGRKTVRTNEATNSGQLHR